LINRLLAKSGEFSKEELKKQADDHVERIRSRFDVRDGKNQRPQEQISGLSLSENTNCF